jgi:hypothetical protein
MQISKFHGDSKFEIRNSKLISNLESRIPNPLIALLLLLAVLSGVSCARIGEPQPPQVYVPIPATDLASRQLSDFVVLTVSKPERNTNGSEVTTLKSVDIYRMQDETGADDAANPVPPELFMKRALRILSIPSSRFPEYLVDKTFVIQDRTLPGNSEAYSHTFRYAVMFINNKNWSAGVSNQAVINPVAVPPPPTALLAEGSQDSIKLRWTAPSENMDGSKPPRIAGYNVYRSEEPQKTPSVQLNRDPVQALEFDDASFRFDTTFHYAVSTVASTKNPNAESLPSAAIEVVTRDVFPPGPPQNFTAILQGNSAILMWAPSSSIDTAGYRIHRHEKGTADRQLIQTELIRNLSFQDSRIDPAKEYDYEIRAVDTHGNESPAVRTALEKR